MDPIPPKHNKSSSSSKISDIVRLQRILKKWKKLANNAPKNTNNNTSSSSSTGNNTTTTIITTTSGSGGGGGSSKGIKFLKRTLSFTDVSSASSSSSSRSTGTDVVPKGFLAVCVGKELQRFVIPTEYLRHVAFGVLLQEAEEEFGFQQEGVLKIPCQVPVFEKILKAVEEKKDVSSFLPLPDHQHPHQNQMDGHGGGLVGWCSPDSYPHHPQQLCS